MKNIVVSEEKVPPSSPLLLVFVGASFLGLVLFIVLGVVSLGCEKIAQNEVSVTHSNEMFSSARSVSQTENSWTARTTRESGWLSQVYSASCPAECVAGSACSASLEEKYQSCLSGMSCIPGNSLSTLSGSEEFLLKLSAIAEFSPHLGDPCQLRRDTWLCLRPTRGGDWSCLSQMDACSNRSGSVASSQRGVRIKGEDLLSSGVDIVVRENGPEGRALARESGFVFKTGIRRRALCGGLRFNLNHSNVNWVSFFLYPAQ